jgi:oligopeptide transport system permease protein
MGLALMGICIPNFVLGPLLILLFVFALDWLPVGGFGGFSQLILPSITLGAIRAAYIARLSRAGMLDVLQQDFVRTARAKGLPERLVVAKHCLRLALLPVLSYLGPAVASILVGSVVVEKIFSIPGLGSFFVNSALNRDYTLAMGTVLLYSALLIALNLLVDIFYSILDPRMELR